MDTTLKPAVADLFYPADPKQLRAQLAEFFRRVVPDYAKLLPPKAMIVPHAGYIYSGQVAASAYACLRNHQNKIKRVVIFAPAHRYPFFGLALPEATSINMPFGKIHFDVAILKHLQHLPQIKTVHAAFMQEHSLEVQLPFLQFCLGDFLLVPLLVGDATSAQIAEVMKLLWDEDETLIVVSSDLSHYLPYERAQKVDTETAHAILMMNSAALSGELACGFLAIQALLQVTRLKGLRAKLLDLRNSGDTAGDRSQVVGYGAFHFDL